MLKEQPDWQDAAKERRDFQRVPVACTGTLLSTALGRADATLTDLSQSGCRLHTRVRCRRGDHLVLRIGPFGPRAVTVAWAVEGMVGIAFAQPLAWTVVTAIAAEARTAVSSADS